MKSHPYVRSNIRKTIQASSNPWTTYKELAFFFLPLGLTSILVTLSHLIINSTLARSANPETVIASYAVAISLYAVLERPAIILRQTCSAMVKDRISFHAMTRLAVIVIGMIMLLSTVIAYTPVGLWILKHLFGVSDRLFDATIQVYRILMFVVIFSGTRVIFHGILISHKRTKWLTIGMFIRLAGMALTAGWIIAHGVKTGRAGAVIFLVGMAIECLVSLWEGGKLSRKYPENLTDHSVRSTGDVFRFYRPLLSASLVAAWIGPVINALLGGTKDAELAIASYSIAMTVSLIFISFSTFTHQIVLNYYQDQSQAVRKFQTFMSLLPAILLSLIAFTPLGGWVLGEVIGVGGDLRHYSLLAIRGMVLYAFLFPWIDYCNGLLMLKQQTKVMTYSQIMNLFVTFISLYTLSELLPFANGLLGSLALSLGAGSELVLDTWAIRRFIRIQRIL